MENNFIAGKEISVSGRFIKTARLRHEWCDFLDSPLDWIDALRHGPKVASLFTFVTEIEDRHALHPFHNETTSLAVLPITTYEKWWEDIGFKTRNKVRKAGKSGVELRFVQLDDAFAEGVESIYGETKVKQGRKFYHYGKKAPEIKLELSSFLDKSILVGAYFKDELVGFMKLYEGRNVLRTVHIIAKMKHREKCAMDALIAKGVELCGQKGIHYLQYGSWTDGGVGVFREKHGFQRMDVPRYYVPLTLLGRTMLSMNLHRPLREHVPKGVIKRLVAIRTKWNVWRFGQSKQIAGDNAG